MDTNEVIADEKLSKFQKEEIKGVNDCDAKNCFICNEELDSTKKFNLVLCKVNHSDTQITELLGQLLEDDWVIVVSEDDFLCCRCMTLLNQMDELEFYLKNIKLELTAFLRNNYNLNNSVEHGAKEAVVTSDMKDEQDIPNSHNYEKSHDAVKNNENTKYNSEHQASMHNKYKNHVRNSFLTYKHTVKKYLNPKVYKKGAINQRKIKTISNFKENENDICEVCGCFILREAGGTHKCDGNAIRYNCSFCNTVFSEELSRMEHETICGNKLKVNSIQNDNKIDDNLIASTTDLDLTSTNRITCLNKVQELNYSDPNMEKPPMHLENNETVENRINIKSPVHIYKCSNCDFTDVSKLIVTQHVDNKCVTQTSVKCEYCHLSFPHKYIKQHVLKQHQHVSSRQCLICKKNFLDKIHLKLHMDKEHKFININSMELYLGNKYATEDSTKVYSSAEVTPCNERTAMRRGNEQLAKDEVLICATCNVTTKDHSEMENHVCSGVEGDCIVLSCNDRTDFHESDQLCGDSNMQLVFCAMCNITTKDYLEMENHVKSHQTSDFNYCSICCDFIVEKDYSKHLLHGSDFQALKCKFCSKQCHDTIHLKCHVNKYHADGKTQHWCKYCIKVYSEKSALFKHIKAKHSVELAEKYCEICQISFKNGKHFNNHVEYAHRKSLHCKFCGKELQSWKKLQYHEKAHLKHNKTTYKCDICNKILKTQTGLRFHKIRHNGNFPYFCEFCGQGFVSSHSLSEHIGHHTKETRYTCDVCGKGFFYYDTMYRHRILHDNPYPKSCDICNKKFRNASRLAIHKRREHTGERPYKCTLCPQSFFTSNGYKHHMCHHTKVFPYNCQPCSKGFTTRHKYATHLSNKHGDHTLVINRGPNNKEWNEQWLK